MGLLDDEYAYGPAAAPTEAEMDRALIGHLTKGGLLGSLQHIGKGLLNYMGRNAADNNAAIAKGAEATGKMLKGGDLTPEEQAAVEKNPAMGIGNADIAAGGFAGTFAGIGAKTADLLKLDEAKQMLKKGAGEAEIRGRTGWFKGADDKWRFEIPDNNLRITGDSFEHPELFEAYPWMKEDTPLHRFERTDDMPVGAEGYTNPETGEIGLLKGLPKVKQRSHMAHELQHKVQFEEGFAPGANPLEPKIQRLAQENLNEAAAEALRIRDEYDTAWKGFVRKSGVAGDPPPELTDQFHQMYPDLAGAKQQSDALIDGLQDEETASHIFDQFAFDAYYRQLGEVEARAVADRLDFTPEQRRMTPPLDTQGIPPEDIIVPEPPKRGLLDWFR